MQFKPSLKESTPGITIQQDYLKVFTPINTNKIANNDYNLALEKNNHNQASNRVNELLGKMMDCFTYYNINMGICKK